MNQLVMARTARRTAPAGRSTTAQPARTRPVASRTANPARPHEWRTLAAVSIAVLAVLLAAMWSFAQGWGRGPVVGPGEIALDGGIVLVDGVIAAAPPEQEMPGMGAGEDEVAEGYRRVSVDVTLQAGAGAMRYSTEGFRLTVDRETAEALVARSILPGDVLPPGTQLSGTILFDVPADATTGTLSYGGAGSTDIVLPPEEERTAGGEAGEPMTGAGHGAAGQPDGATPLGVTAPEDPAAAGR